MFKMCVRVLALAALGLAFAAPRPSHAADSMSTAPAPAMAPMSAGQISPNNWSHAYVLTPLEQKRLRAKGLKDQEIYLIANAASQSWKDVDFLVDRYFTNANQTYVLRQLNILPGSLLVMRPEWSTPEWQAAVERGDYVWISGVK